MTKTKLIHKGVELMTEQGDLTRFEVDALVNPANSRLIMGGGVAGAILRAGGNVIQEEALKKAPIPIGMAVATTAGKLKAKYVIHAPTMSRPAMPTSKENVRQATKAALECAEQLKIRSLALPGLGTGVGGLDLHEAAEVMVSETKRHVESGTSLKNVVLVGFSSDLVKAFERAMQK